MQTKLKIEVLNKHHLKAGQEIPFPTVNIMRPNPLGNPFPIVDDRDDVVDQFDVWLEDQLKAGNAKICEALDTIMTLASQENGVGLICCCKPQRCHGDVIKKYVLNAAAGLEPWAHPPVLTKPLRFIRKNNA